MFWQLTLFPFLSRRNGKRRLVPRASAPPRGADAIRGSRYRDASTFAPSARQKTVRSGCFIRAASRNDDVTCRNISCFLSRQVRVPPRPSIPQRGTESAGDARVKIPRRDRPDIPY